MSKMFEALRRTEGNLAEVAKAVLAEETPAVPTGCATDARSTFCDSVPHPSQVQLDHSDRIRSVTLNLPVGSPVLPFHGGADRAAEQYRIIRTKISHHPGNPRAVLVSSPMPGDGKTINAINLAAALSLQEDSRVLLLDCDFRRSSATKLLGLSATPGLGEVLRNEARLEDSLVRINEYPNLYVLPPGVTSPGPAELLGYARWKALMEVCASEFRFVVIDAPPIGAVAEYELLELACDGVVLVIRQDHTNRQLWRKALETISKEKQLGVILNCTEEWCFWKTHSYYYYSGQVQ